MAVKSEPLELTDAQRKRAEVALEVIRRKEIPQIQDFVDKWRTYPRKSVLHEIAEGKPYEDREQRKEWVAVEDIRGSDRGPTHDVYRIKPHFTQLLEGRFRPRYEVEGTSLPRYVEIAGDLYVGIDGNHRSIACKAVGVDEIFAQVTPIPVDEEKYQRWIETTTR